MKGRIESLEGELQKAECRFEETERGRRAAEGEAADARERVSALETEVQSPSPLNSKQPPPPEGAKVLKPGKWTHVSTLFQVMSLKERVTGAALELEATREEGRVEMEREMQRVRGEAEEELSKLRADNVDLRSEPSTHPPLPWTVSLEHSSLNPRPLITSHHPSIINHQSPIINHQSPIIRPLRHLRVQSTLFKCLYPRPYTSILCPFL
jgi:hypothetical protein